MLSVEITLARMIVCCVKRPLLNDVQEDERGPPRVAGCLQLALVAQGHVVCLSAYRLARGTNALQSPAAFTLVSSVNQSTSHSYGHG